MSIMRSQTNNRSDEQIVICLVEGNWNNKINRKGGRSRQFEMCNK